MQALRFSSNVLTVLDISGGASLISSPRGPVRCYPASTVLGIKPVASLEQRDRLYHQGEKTSSQELSQCQWYSHSAYFLAIDVQLLAIDPEYSSADTLQLAYTAVPPCPIRI